MIDEFGIPATLGVIRQIESLGYHVSVHRLPLSLFGSVGPAIEMHAIDPPQVHVARIADTVDEADVYRCACLLATMVGIELEE